MRRSNFLFLFLLYFVSFIHAEQIQTIYGSFEIDEPVLIELIHSKAFERLKKIHQYGVVHYIHSMRVDYNRHEHSLGVLVLLRKFGASLKEQIAGLLHDVSHTVFSHVGDHVAAQLQGVMIDQNAEAYQDDMHCWYLSQTDVAPILKKYGYTVDDINHKGGNFAMLERSLPDICADRLEYQLFGAYAERLMEQEDVQRMVAAITYSRDKWVFTDQLQAKLFARNSIKLCLDIFGSYWNAGSYEQTAFALIRAVQLGLLSMQDIHFGTDDDIWQKLHAMKDPVIKLAVGRAACAKDIYEQTDDKNPDLIYKPKFRGIDPWVQTDDGIYLLSEIDTEFAQEFHAAKLQCEGIKQYSFRY